MRSVLPVARSVGYWSRGMARRIRWPHSEWQQPLLAPVQGTWSRWPAPSVPAEAWQDHAGEEPEDRRWVQEGFARARDYIAETSPAQIDLRIEEGRHPAQSLCAYASDHVFDLLVLGRHGDGGVLHPRFGHVAKAAATASTVPVLLVSAS